jgi:TRAP-type uncharacterized transport system substrate-binding protein
MTTPPPTEGARRLGDRVRLKGELSPGMKMLLLFVGLAVLAVLFAVTNPEASLRHLRVGFLSGDLKGNYFATVDRVAVAASRRKGRVTNLVSAGSVENVQRLIEARKGCRIHFALVQEGTEWPEGHSLELIGRLTRPESLVVLGRNADRMSSVTDLRGLRVGLGPVGSGTEALARRLLFPLGALDLNLTAQPIEEQLQKLERGELDLGAMVIDEDAEQLQRAVRSRNLQILNMPRAPALAYPLPFLREGRIEAGHYDAVRGLPPTDKTVLDVDTLIIGNGCASRSAIEALIGVFADLDPTFLRHNRETSNLSGLPYAAVARRYYDTGEPELLGIYAPWVIDIMPTASWVQLVLAISVLFNAMGAASRFRLWRLDVARVRLEDDVRPLFPSGTTVAEIASARPEPGLTTEELQRRLQSLVHRLEALHARCRKQALSILVPMGGEMAYRYQEGLMLDLIRALRTFGDRLGR